MSKREDKSIDHSIKVLPNQPGYVSIPIPPRLVKSAKKPGKGVFSCLSKIRFRRRLRHTLTRAERIQKKDLEQSIAIAVVVNLLVIFALLFIVIKTPVLSDGSLVSVQAGDESSAKDEKSDVTDDSSGQVQTASKTLLAGAATSTSTEIQTVPLSTMESRLDMMQFEPPPLSFGRSVENYEMGGIPGVDRAFLESLFPKSRFGNGSRLALFVDDSGSMREINDAVSGYVHTHFRHALIRTVDNCKMHQAENSFAMHLGDAALNSPCTDFVFVCDLQDQQTEKGITIIQGFLTQGNAVRRLHIISFDRRPRTHLSALIESTGGTLTLIDLP